MSEKINEIKEAFEFAKLSAESFGVEVTIKPELIDIVLSLLQLGEQQKQALEQIDNIAEACGAEAHIVRKIARKALGKEETT